MAATGISLHKVPHFPTTLASAALEWLLIFLLFIHAIFSYLITKFARYCNLQIPCLLCSRLDHVLGSEKLGFHWDLICRHHKVEISSLVVCHVHNKLVDVHGMCENCLFSFATINKSNAETYRLLVGKLGEDSPGGCDEDPFEDHKNGGLSKRICSCCGEPYVLRNHAENLLQSHFDFDDLKNSRKEPTEELQCYDPLPHVEYSKVKNFSDTESEVPFSDDDDGVALIRQSKREFVVKSIPMVPRVISQPDDLVSEKLIHTDSLSELSLIDMQGLIGNNDLVGSGHASLNMTIGHGLEEISWLHVEPKADPPLEDRNSESFDEIPQASDVIVTQVQESKLRVDGTEIVDQIHETSKNVTYEETMPVIERGTIPEIPYAVYAKVTEKVQTEHMSSEEVTDEELKPVVERASPEIQSVVNDNITKTVKVEQVIIEKDTCEEIKPVIEREASPETPSVVDDEIPEIGEMNQTVDENVTHNEIEPVIEREPSPETKSVVNDNVTETVELKEIGSEKATHEEKKPIIQNGSSSEIPSVVNDSIPDNLEIGEAYKLAVGNNRRQLSGKLFEQRSLKDSIRISEDFQLLLSQISAARGIDLPFEFSPRLSGNIDEVRAEASSFISTQIAQRRTLERNESGLSQDGSFIGEIEGESEVDRLKRQVEHDKRLMSALYKELEEERNASGIAANQAMAMITRLQEEKASLQMEALQCVRMMEEQAEYDVEALQRANDLLAEKEKEMQDLEADLELYRNNLDNISILEREMESREFSEEQSDSNHFKNSENVESTSTVDKPQAFSKDDLTNNSYSEFEDERLYVLECLRKLEKKLHLFSYDGVNFGEVDTEQTREDKKVVLEEPNCREEENDCGEPCYSRVSRVPDAVAIGDEVSNLIKRLEALEADRNGVDHSLTSLKRGDQDIELQSGDSLSPQGSVKE